MEEDGTKLSPTTADVEPLTYSRYLKLGELISLQRPLSNPPAHDEMLFIVIHQAYELWFKQVVFELDAFIGHLAADRMWPAVKVLERVHEIFRLLIQQIAVLETMTPAEFNRFRGAVTPASGFQSFQFREIELVAGANLGEIVASYHEAEWRVRLAARAGMPNMRDALLGVLRRRGVLLGTEPDAIRDALLRVCEDDGELSTLQILCEHLVQFDEQVLLWRFRHVQLAERMIGRKIGTGGSRGVAYLESTLQKRFFPELWDVRTAMKDGKQYH